MKVSRALRAKLEALAAESGTPAPAKPRKYRNVPVVADGIRFDSRKEAARWAQLRLLEGAGRITSLEAHPRFPLVVNGQKVGTYVADFSYTEAGALVVEDAKSDATRRLPTYRLKKKLVKALHGIDVVEV